MSAVASKGLEAKTFPHLSEGLEGISKTQLENHFKLYNGYVTNTNTLLEKYTKLDAGTPEWNELRRRFGFEVNGVVLHEYYFGNLKKNGGALPNSTKLYKALEENFGSYEKWEADFKATGKMRGIGWAILYQCSCTGALVNCWVSDHENGHPAGFKPILVLDVWEHAFVGDYAPTEKPNYIDAFFKNIDWEAAESRLS